jgi:hypothetical protein
MSRIPATASAVGAPETELTEIEVTPEMLDARASLLLEFHRERHDEDDFVKRIYLAMRQHAPK